MNRRHMKYTLSFLLFLLAAATVTVPAAGQHADARIGALLNSGDYFTLREVLPRQADSIAPERAELYQLCAQYGVGITVMKATPVAGCSIPLHPLSAWRSRRFNACIMR